MSLRARLYALEVDEQTLAADPVRNGDALRVLRDAINGIRQQLGAAVYDHYPVAVELTFYRHRVRVIVDSPREADRIECAWLRRHGGGGSSHQRAEYSSWAAPLLTSQQRKSA
jgi:hypothetical protein